MSPSWFPSLRARRELFIPNPDISPPPLPPTHTDLKTGTQAFKGTALKTNTAGKGERQNRSSVARLASDIIKISVDLQTSLNAQPELIGYETEAHPLRKIDADTDGLRPMRQPLAPSLSVSRPSLPLLRFLPSGPPSPRLGELLSLFK